MEDEILESKIAIMQVGDELHYSRGSKYYKEIIILIEEDYIKTYVNKMEYTILKKNLYLNKGLLTYDIFTDRWYNKKK